MKDLAGKVAIVTGGATLIGAAVVKALRNYGAKLALFDIDAAGGDRVVSADPVGSHFWQFDITDGRQLTQGVADVVAHFG